MTDCEKAFKKYWDAFVSITVSNRVSIYTIVIDAYMAGYCAGQKAKPAAEVVESDNFCNYCRLKGDCEAEYDFSCFSGRRLTVAKEEG